jgi:hypothetical protein
MNRSNTQSLVLQNGTGAAIQLILEPWAEEWTIEVGQSLILVGEGPPDAAQFIVQMVDPTTVVVHGWSGCIVTLFRDGEQLASGSHGFPAI